VSALLHRKRSGGHSLTQVDLIVGATETPSCCYESCQQEIIPSIYLIAPSEFAAPSCRFNRGVAKFWLNPRYSEVSVCVPNL
jgi:hypothetical protein